MRKSAVMLTAALLLGGSSFAYAQSGQSQSGQYGQSGQHWQSGQGQWGQQSGQGQWGQQYGQSGQGQWGQRYGQSGQGQWGQQNGQSGRFGQRRQFGQSGTTGQGQWGQAQRGQSGQYESGRFQSGGGQAAGSRTSLRRQLRQLGFQNVRILDSAYLVEARTQDGRPVLMLIDPPSRVSAIFGPRQQQQTGQGMMGQHRMGQMGMGQMGQRGQTSGQQNQQSDQATTGRAPSGQQQQALGPEQIRNVLDQAGYTNVTNLQREGDQYVAQAEQADTTYDLRIDAKSGSIVDQQEADESN